jgi:hypothetical protein
LGGQVDAACHQPPFDLRRQEKPAGENELIQKNGDLALSQPNECLRLCAC